MIIAGAKYPEAQRILVAHLDNLLQTETFQNLKNVRCVRLDVCTQTHTHTTSGRRLPHMQEKEGTSPVRLTLLTLSQQHSITPTPPQVERSSKHD